MFEAGCLSVLRYPLGGDGEGYMNYSVLNCRTFNNIGIVSMLVFLLFFTQAEEPEKHQRILSFKFPSFISTLVLQHLFLPLCPLTHCKYFRLACHGDTGKAAKRL